ncbi:MAG: tetratricopeptide repeat protein [Bacteroidales bacterium]|nr:tetratricopeptide repeat protein [Bacteroidales bacterium]MCF8388715.1 tetratricopeptide repeat protein [Bacteroidales bacterium]MCF8399517.1 tetratricopeptide repeat protein [Bacteroidales bacterium]
MSVHDKIQRIKGFNAYVFILFMAIGFAVYSNSFSVPFHLDDTAQIQLSQDTKSLDSYKDFAYWTNFISNRPLSKFSLALNYQVHQDEVFGYHLINLIIHVLTSFFVFLFIREILRSPVLKNESLRSNKKFFALAVALLFLVHPIQTQSVTYIVQRMSSMAGLFYLLSCYLYLKARYAWIAGNRTSYWIFILAALSGLFAMYSKQNAIIFPVAWLLIDFFFIRNKENRVFKKYLIFATSTLVIAFLIISFTGNLPRETREIGRAEYLFTQFKVIMKYIQLSFIPVGQSIDHDIPVSANLIGIKELFSLMGIILMMAIGVLFYKNKPLISFGIFWFLINLLVTSSIIPIKDVVFEHRLYLPVFGIIVILTSVVFQLFSKARLKYLPYALLAIVLIFSVMAFSRNNIWHSKFSLWKDAVEKAPNKARPNQNYGIALLEKGDYKKARIQFNKVIEIDPEHVDAHFNRGNVRYKLGDYAGAVSDLEFVLQSHPKTPEAYDIIGKSKAKMKDFEGAVTAYDALIQSNPDYQIAYFNRGKVNAVMQNFRDALEDFKTYLDFNAANAEVMNLVGQTYLEIKDKDSALLYFDKAIDINNNFAMAYYNRGYLQASRRRFNAARRDFSAAIKIDPNLSFAYRGRGMVYYWTGEFKRAYQDMKRANELGMEIPKELMSDLENKLRVR